MTRDYNKWNNTSLTDHASLILRHANEDACYLKHESIATKHLLMGLLRVCLENSTCVASVAIKGKSVDLLKYIRQIIILAAHNMTVMGNLPLTHRAMHVLNHAEEEAKALRHNFINTEHILLGLLKETESIAERVLKTHEFTFKEVRETVKRIYAKTSEVKQAVEVNPLETIMNTTNAITECSCVREVQKTKNTNLKTLIAKNGV